MKRQHLALLIALGVFAAAGTAGAVTVDDVFGLHRAGASDAIIISKIDTDGTVFRLTVDEIIQLKNAGVSDAVITYMINTGKSELAPQQAPPVATAPAPVPREEVYEEQPPADSDVQGSVYMSMGGYYPNWPGYGWSYYYDPFWWPSFSFYFGYWSPYPYYAYYYDPFYNCHPYANDYWYNDYGHGYYGDSYYDRHDKGRHVGGRGGLYADRSIKSPGARIRSERTMGSPVASPEVTRAGRKDPGQQVGNRRVTAPEKTIRRPVQQPGVRRSEPVQSGSVRRASPGSRSNRGLRTPRNPSTPVDVRSQEVKPNPTPSRVGKPARTSGVSRPAYSGGHSSSGGRSPSSASPSRSGGSAPRSSGGGRRSK